MKRILSLCCLIATLIAAGAADLHAQNVAVDKTSLNFAAQFGGPPVNQTLTVSSTGAAIQFFVSNNNTSWLKVNGAATTSGTTPSAVTITADPAGLFPGTYTATVFVSGGALTIPVTASLTVSTIGVNPSSLTFGGYTVGSGSIPNAQTINLSGAATQFSAAATTTSGGNWLQVTPTTGTSPSVLFAQLNSAVVPGMAAGTYQGNIRITPSGGSTNIPIDIPVTFTVSAAPVVTISPTTLQYNLQINGTNNFAAQTFTIAVTPAAQLTYSFASSVDPNPAGKNWILINPPAGSTNPTTGIATVNIGIDTVGLTAATYNGIIRLSTPGGTPAQQDIPVRLVISNSPLLTIPNATLNFTSQLGCTVPAAQNVNVTATSGSLAYTVSTSANTPWLTVSANGSTAAPMSVSVNPCGLTPGTYTGTITVAGTVAGTGSQQIPVVFKVTNDPMIVTNVGAFSFPFQIGQSIPAAQLLRITSSTGTPLSFTATPSQATCPGSWLLVNSSGGTPISGSTDASLAISINPTGLPAGTCTGSISIAATVPSSGVAAVNSPLTIPVTLYVSNSALLLLTPSAPVTFTAAVGAQSVPSQNIFLSSTSPTDQLTYTVTVPPTSNGGAWLAASPQAGTTGSSGTVTLFVNPSLLSAGTYTGSIVVAATGPGGAAVANSPVTIPVTLNITTGSITLSSSSLTFGFTAAGSAPAPQTVSIGSSTGAPITYSAVASSTGSWLSVSPANGNTSANGTLTVTVDNTKLTAPGTYAGTITVTAPGAGNSPAIINVTVNVGGGALIAPTTTLTFTQAAGGTAPAAQTISVTASPVNLGFTATTSGAAWLSVSPASGTTPGSVQVSVNAGAMAIGQYTGSVIIASLGASGSPITVPVVLNVVGSQTISATPTSLNFSFNIGQTAPAAQNLAIAITGSGGPFSAAVQYGPGTGGWLQVTPASGNAPGTVSVAVTPGSLTAGTYTATIAITSSNALTTLSVPVTLTVVQIPKPVITAIGNAANYSTGGIAPGENIVIFGTGIGPAAVVTGTVANNVWSSTTGNTRVLFDGVAAPVIYASDKQTSVMVPYGLNGRNTTSIVVEYSGVQSNALGYNVVAAAPGIYTLNQQGNGPGAILNQDGVTVNGTSTPAAKGSVVSVYMTGEGQTNPAGVDGAIIPAVFSALKRPLLTVTATVAGINAPVQYAGSAAGLISGVMQVNVTIPANAPTGAAVPIVITVGTFTTQAGVTVAVQ